MMVILLVYHAGMVYLKNLIMTDVTLFLHEDFLCRILETFPSLEKYTLINGGNPYVINFIGTKNLVAVLESLCRIKRVSISNLVLVLGQRDDLDSAQTKVIFENAQKIINKKFDQRSNFKIVDEKNGYVLKKKEDEEASIFNMQEVNGCKVIKKSYDEKEEKFVLTVEGKEDNLILPKEVVKSLLALLPAEDQDLNDSDRMIDDDEW